MESADPPPTVLARTGSPGSDPTLTSADYTRHAPDHENTSNLAESQGTESMPIEWTDEKHSLYLKSMETTFVNQLYSSFGSLHWMPRREDPKSSTPKHASNCVPSGQYKVLRGGCWAKIDFRRDGSQLNKAVGSGVLANPWIRHFKPRHQVQTSPASQEKAALATTNQFPVSQSPLYRHDSVDSSSEVTDQNFVDEDFERENSSKLCSTKRMKTTEVATSSNDQVVPFGVFPESEDVGKNCVSSKE